MGLPDLTITPMLGVSENIRALPDLVSIHLALCGLAETDAKFICI